MRLASLPSSSAAVLLLISGCTVDNTSKPASASDKSVGGTAASGPGLAGSSAVTNSGGLAGGDSPAGGSAAAGSSSSAGTSAGWSSGNSAGNGNALGGQSSVGGVSATGGGAFAGSDRGSGGSNAAGSGLSLGGANSAGNGPAFGGRSVAGSGNGVGGTGFAGTTGLSGGSGVAKLLPPATFVFERKIASSRDHLVAMDFVTRAERVITTLVEGSVDGWNIDGVTVSPDRTRIVLASLYGATAADIATGLATNRLWSLDTEGTDFRRLTPVFPNTHAGQSNWRIDVRDPAYSPDGQYITFDYGEGDFTSGYVAPWVTAADGSSLPSLISTNLDCSVNGNATFHPLTGDLLIEHVVCIGGFKGGFFLYPNGGGTPDHLVSEEGMSISSEPPAFSVDGSIFVYSGRTYSDNIQSLYAYIMSERRVVTLVQGAVGRDIVNASFAPDNRHMVYCVREGDAYDLRLLDLGVDPPTDTALTNDGVSCDAVF